MQHQAPTQAALSGPAIRSLLFMLLALGFLLTPALASAHATLIETNPEDNAVLDAPPETIVLGFNEPVRLPEDGFRLLDSSGEETPLDAVSRDSDVEIASPANLDDGTYILSWRVISADDHPINGVLTFSIGEESDEPVVVPDTESDRTLTTIQKIVQGIGYLGLLASSGLMLFHLGSRGIPEAPPASYHVTLGTASIMMLVAHAILVPITVAVQQGTGFEGMIDGSEWMPLVPQDQVISLAMVVLGFALMLWSYPVTPEFPSRRITALIGIGLLVIAPTLTGHTRVFEPTWGMMTSNILHTVAAAIWFGGLLGLILQIRAIPLHPQGQRTTDVATLLSRFSTLALFAVGALVLSGLVSGWIVLRGVDPFFTTTYGQLILAKIGLAGIACLLAAWNRFRLVPAIDASHDDRQKWSSLKRIVGLEIVAIIAIIFVTGFLTNQPPATADVSSSPPTELVQSSEFDGGTAHITLTPGETGQNDLMIELVDPDGEPIEPVDVPEASFLLPANDIGPIPASVSEGEQPGSYAASIDVPFPGEWELELKIRTSRFEQPILTIPLEIPEGD